jgi:hypothetical protein
MAKIIVLTNLTLDGVMQAPAGPDEDPRDGFQHGGWAAPYGAMQEVGDVFANVGSVLFGRRTYENFSPSGRTSRVTPSDYLIAPRVCGSRPWNPCLVKSTPQG